MKQYAVTFSVRALRNLHTIRSYFAQRFDLPSAEKFADDIVADCDSLATAPYRGTPVTGRTDQYRLSGIAKGRVTVLFEIKTDEVKILALRYGGYR